MKQFDSVREMYRAASRWVKNGYALDRKPGKSHLATGNDVSERSKKAVCWCLRGAINHVYGEGKRSQAVRDRTEDAIAQLFGRATSIESWNDQQGRTIEDVRRVVRLAKI